MVKCPRLSAPYRASVLGFHFFHCAASTAAAHFPEYGAAGGKSNCQPRSAKLGKAFEHRHDRRSSTDGRTFHTSKETRDVPQRKLGKEHPRGYEAEFQVVSVPKTRRSARADYLRVRPPCLPHPLISSIVSIDGKGNIEFRPICKKPAQSGRFSPKKLRHRRFFRGFLHTDRHDQTAATHATRGRHLRRSPRRKQE